MASITRSSPCWTKIWDGGLAQLQEYMYSDFGRLHVRYKTATWLRGMIPSPAMRAPMPRPRRDEVSTLATSLTACGLAVIGTDAIARTADRLNFSSAVALHS